MSEIHSRASGESDVPSSGTSQWELSESKILLLGIPKLIGSMKHVFAALSQT